MMPNEAKIDRNILIERARRLLDKISDSTSQWDLFIAADALNETAHELRKHIMKENENGGAA